MLQAPLHQIFEMARRRLNLRGAELKRAPKNERLMVRKRSLPTPATAAKQQEPPLKLLKTLTPEAPLTKNVKAGKKKKVKTLTPETPPTESQDLLFPWKGLHCLGFVLDGIARTPQV